MKRYNNILFIGNSLTFYNNLPEMFGQVARGEGENPYIQSITKGFYRLFMFADKNDPYGALVEDTLNSRHFDLVILQEQSHFPVTHYDEFLEAVRYFRKRLPEDTDIMLYQTWAYDRNMPQLQELDLTAESMALGLREGYRKAAEDIHAAAVIPAGTAFYRLSKRNPDEPQLILPDMRHPTVAGTYLAALCHYTVIYGWTPVGAEFIPADLSPETAALLQKAALQAVKNPEIV